MTDINKIDYLDNQAHSLFSRLLNAGRRSCSIPARIMGINKSIMDLKTLMEIVPVSSMSSDAIQDVSIDKIIGTENRSQDFSGCFFPRHQWMMERWVKIYKLMHSDGISEPVKLIEYGGYYFVRDGNHRVSVAMNSGIEYLTAEVIHYRIPFNLPENLGRKNLDLLSEKYVFHQRTKIFNLIHDDLFIVHSAKTWKKLETEIFEHSRSWFVRYYGRQPDNAAEFIAAWVTFYNITVEHIRQKSLLMLFPGMGETDVFVEIVEYWNTYKDPDSFWFGEIYDKFESYIRRRRFFLWINQLLSQIIRRITATAEDEKNFFLHSTRVMTIIPEFNVPVAGKNFFDLCYKQIFRIYARLLMDREHKQPDISDMNRLWYGTFYKPVVDRYRTRLYQITFERFYELFSKRYYHRIINAKASAEACLDEFEKKLLK